MLKEINYLRFFFCLAVFFVHWHGRSPAEIQSQLTYLHNIHTFLNTTPIHFAVIGFIVLSGFCIHISSHSMLQQPFGIKKYFIRRAFRIFPVLILGTLMGLGMYFFYPNEGLDWWGLIRGFNGPLLTVMIEVLLYALYVPFMIWITKSKKAALTAIVCIGFVGLWSAFYTKLNWPFRLSYHSVIGYFPYWWLGAGAAHIYLQSHQYQKFLKLKIHIPLFIATAVMCTAYAMYYEEVFKSNPNGMTYYRLGYMVLYSIMLAAFLTSIHRKSQSKHEISHYLQMPAYSLYAIHYPITFLPVSYGSLIGTIVLSYVVYFIIEKPAQDYGIALTRRMGPH